MPYRTGENNILLKLTGIGEDALQGRERHTLFKVVGVEEDALQKRAKHSILALKKMPHRRGRNMCGWN